MSIYDYRSSLRIASLGEPFYALIMAAMRQADTGNLARLKDAFPETWADLSSHEISRKSSSSVELERRYNAPGGVLPEDEK